MYENEKFDIKDDEFKTNVNPNVDLPPGWIYADNISLGYEITDKNKTMLSKQNHRQIGEPTAYAVAIEARFCQDYIINKQLRNTNNRMRTNNDKQ